MARRIIIRDRSRNLFLTQDRQWSGDETAAQQFESTLFAVTICLREKISGAEVVVKISGHPDTVLPVDTGAEHPGNAGWE
jgi:hypothetical protein